MKVRDSKGYAYMLKNVEQFGSKNVIVKHGYKVIFEGPADAFVEKFANVYPFALCADVIDGETPVILF